MVSQVYALAYFGFTGSRANETGDIGLGEWDKFRHRLVFLSGRDRDIVAYPRTNIQWYLMVSANKKASLAGFLSMLFSITQYRVVLAIE